MTHTPDSSVFSGPTGIPLLEARGVCFTYPGAVSPVLSSATLRLMPGDRVGLLGHNGSGKTTLFHILMGLVSPHAGEVCFKGTVLRKEKDFRTLRRAVGLLFQQADDQLFCPTVLEDVAFGPLNLGYSPDEARETALETLSSLELHGLADRVTHRLSGGEKKLVALAAVLSMRPEALLLDEPTNDLDPATRERLIAHINALPVTRCVISHDWDFLEQTCGSFVTIRHGAIHETTISPHTHRHAHMGGDARHSHAEPDAPETQGALSGKEENVMQR